MSVELKPHQVTAVGKMRDGTVLTGGVGTGKTVTALWYYFVNVLGGTVGDYSSIKNPMDLYVFTTARKRDSQDWQNWALEFGLSRDRDASIGHCTVTVDSYNNIQNYKDVKNAFIVLDEQRMVGSGAWTKAFLKMAKTNRWIMLSATPGDKWEDYIPLFVANGFYKNRSEFKREHCVYSYYGKFPKLERYMAVGKLVRLRNSILIKMPYERHTTRYLQTCWAEYDQELYKEVVQKRWNPFLKQPLRDAAELFSVTRKIVNSDYSRVAALSSLMESRSKLIVFYNFDYELENLREFASGIQDPSFSVAEYNGHKHQDLPTTDRWLYLVQYRSGAEAWNCTTTDSMVFYSLTYSYRDFEQCQGRIDRLNTPFSKLNYYIMMSKSPIDRAISRALRNKEDFNEKSAGLYT